MPSDINNAMGEQLKRARVANKWSLDTTSKYTGVSKAMLGQIERGESSPTITRLWKIASGFDLPLSYFLVTIGDHSEDDKKREAEQGISAITLSPFDSVTGIEILSLTLMPLHQQLSTAHNVGVVEHIIVIKGEMEYYLDGKWKYLRQGETIKFNADKEHGYRNMTEKKSIFHNIICYTEKK